MSTERYPVEAPLEPDGSADRAPGPGDGQSPAEQARARAREQVDQRASDLGARASSAADDLRGVAEHLRSQGRDGPASLVEQAAQRVAGAGDYLQGTDGNRILHDMESLGRRRPWAAIAGGLATGIAASRFLKASSRERYQTTGRHGTTSGQASVPVVTRPQTGTLADAVGDRVGPGSSPAGTPAGGVSDG